MQQKKDCIAYCGPDREKYGACLAAVGAITKHNADASGNPKTAAQKGIR